MVDRPTWRSMAAIVLVATAATDLINTFSREHSPNCESIQWMDHYNNKNYYAKPSNKRPHQLGKIVFCNLSNGHGLVTSLDGQEWRIPGKPIGFALIPHLFKNKSYPAITYTNDQKGVSGATVEYPNCDLETDRRIRIFDDDVLYADIQAPNPSVITNITDLGFTYEVREKGCFNITMHYDRVTGNASVVKYLAYGGRF